MENFAIYRDDSVKERRVKHRYLGGTMRKRFPADLRRSVLNCDCRNFDACCRHLGPLKQPMNLCQFVEKWVDSFLSDHGRAKTTTG